MRGDRTGWLILLAWAVVLPGGAGCAPAGSHERYFPAEQAARQALDQALTAWQEGRPPGLVAHGPPAVNVVDSHRKPGQQLRRYEILGAVPGEGPRQFVARLTLGGPDEEQKARFVVLGKDPLWVFRQEDLDMICRWEHAMPAANDTRKETEQTTP